MKIFEKLYIQKGDLYVQKTPFVCTSFLPFSKIFVHTNWSKKGHFLGVNYVNEISPIFERFLQREYEVATNVEISTFSGILIVKILEKK